MALAEIITSHEKGSFCAVVLHTKCVRFNFRGRCRSRVTEQTDLEQIQQIRGIVPRPVVISKSNVSINLAMVDGNSVRDRTQLRS